MLVMEDEVEPCYCGHTGIDHEGCKCFTPTNMEEKPLWKNIDEEIIGEYYPKEEDFEWEGWEHDEMIPWTFTSEEVDKEKFLVLHQAWNGDHNVIAFTSTTNFPHTEEGEIDDTYHYIVYRNNKLWRIAINANMGLEYIGVIQELPEYFYLVDFFLNIEYEDK